MIACDPEALELEPVSAEEWFYTPKSLEEWEEMRVNNLAAEKERGGSAAPVTMQDDFGFDADITKMKRKKEEAVSKRQMRENPKSSRRPGLGNETQQHHQSGDAQQN